MTNRYDVTECAFTETATVWDGVCRVRTFQEPSDAYAWAAQRNGEEES